MLARLQKSRVWPDHTGYRIAQGWIEPDVSVSWPDQRRDEKCFLGSPKIAVERKTMTVYSKRHDEVIRRVVDREYRSDSVDAQATFSVAEIFD
jgi:hypothetical protein